MGTNYLIIVNNFAFHFFLNVIPNMKNTATAKTVSTKKGDASIALFLDSIYPLSKKAMDFVVENSYPLELKRGSFLVKPGERENQLFLLKKGVVRSFILENKKEITTWINEEIELVSGIRTLGLQLPSEEYIEALENCELTGIPYSAIEYLYETFPSSNYIGRVILEESYRAAEERAYLARISSAKKRYDRFVATQPTLLTRISLKYIASYLNMSLETLSRLRSRKS
ncbi:MAG: Crp/Fnr family transcriptional regulator [Chitinophagaceae bacterium]|nr:MAG: Crp/Fnr family transcriptional regulator [Chitinophagaceae bacterium]